MRLRSLFLCTLALPLCTLPAIAQAAGAPAAAKRGTPAPKGAVAGVDHEIARTQAIDLLKSLTVDFQRFRLPNGLEVVVVPDRTATQVLVSMNYRVGARAEPEGKSGFAHLFEHLMFQGSANAPGDYFQYLKTVGASINGSTSNDRTNYYQVVPTGALERALFLESDRMGYFTETLTQAVLDEQRGVVENEKRNGASSPTSIAGDMIAKNLHPEGHPYRRTVIGSMRDLRAASLEDVKDWFKRYYGPNNAVLVLSGDVDVDTAKRLVSKYFGAIPAGPAYSPPPAPPVLLKVEKADTLTAPVTSPVLYRAWPVPGLDDKENFGLDILSMTLGNDKTGLTSSLVRDKKLFSQISIQNTTREASGQFLITALVAPGVDLKVATAALDREVASLLARGPSRQEINEFMAPYIMEGARGYEHFSVRGGAVQDATLVYNDPSRYKEALVAYTGFTQAGVRALAAKWLLRPSYRLTLIPGPRVLPDDDAGIGGDAAGTPAEPASIAAAATPAEAPAAAGTRGPIPPVAPTRTLPFPAIQQTQLSNGIKLAYAYRPDATFTTMRMRLPNGLAAVPEADAVKYGYMCSMAKMGFNGMDDRDIRRMFRLSATTLSLECGVHESSMLIDTPSNGLGRTLGWAKAMLTNPTFSGEALKDAKKRELQAIAQSRLSSYMLMRQVFEPLIDAASPTLRNSVIKPGFAAKVQAVALADLRPLFDGWFRPEGGAIDAVSNLPLAEVVSKLEATLGTWRGVGDAAPFAMPTFAPKPAPAQIVLVDLPSEVQASVSGGQSVPMHYGDPNEAADLANNALGGSFNGRLNMNLRETKHWSYGVNGWFATRPSGAQYTVSARIQQDKVGPAIAEILREVRDITTDKPITRTEFADIHQNALSSAGHRFTTGSAVLNEMVEARSRKLPVDYAKGDLDRLRAITLDKANAALREQLNADKWVWTIVGNAKVIEPQLAALGLPVKVIDGSTVIPKE